jgi:hypothetical protein
MPFGTKSSATSPPWTNRSPASLGESPADVDMLTPSSAGLSPPAGVTHGEGSSLCLAVRERRSKLFLEGHFHDVLATLSNKEQM